MEGGTRMKAREWGKGMEADEWGQMQFWCDTYHTISFSSEANQCRADEWGEDECGLLGGKTVGVHSEYVARISTGWPGESSSRGKRMFSPC